MCSLSVARNIRAATRRHVVVGVVFSSPSPVSTSPVGFANVNYLHATMGTRHTRQGCICKQIGASKTLENLLLVFQLRALKNGYPLVLAPNEPLGIRVNNKFGDVSVELLEKVIRHIWAQI